MKKKGAITTVIILFICAAVYLNMQTEKLENDDERVSEKLVESSVTESKSQDKTDTKIDSEDVLTNEEYFKNARFEKEKARDSAITTLKEAVEEETLSQESRDKAVESIETISTGAISETRIETLVKAKGYADCVALINQEGVNVIVTAPKEGLTASDITKIKDIAVGETEFSPGQIKIIEIK